MNDHTDTTTTTTTTTTTPAGAADRSGPDLTFQDEVRDLVRDAYRSIPTGAGAAVTERYYDAHDLTGIPDDALAWALGVGDPVGQAGLQDGEVVLDVGCGGGLDSLLAARRVGPSGRVIGLDLLDEMCERAEAAARSAGLADRCRFETGLMEAIPLDDDTVDAVISNGALNLSARKSRTFAELARVLRPGGRLWASDLTVDEGTLPPEVLASGAAWAGCLAGALAPRVLRRKLERAGFIEVEITPVEPFGVDQASAYPLFPDELLAALRRLLPSEDLQRLATSVVITARRPASEHERPVVEAPRADPLVHTGVRALDDIAPDEVEAPGVTIRHLKRVDDVDLKVMDVEAGGSTPYHVHPHAHEGVIVQGHGALRLQDGDQPLTPGDVFWVNPTEPHAIAAAPDRSIQLVCMDCFVD